MKRDTVRNKYHHAGFDIVANRVMEILEEYTDKSHYMNGNICYWITGHSMGAGVANLVGANLVQGTSSVNNRVDNVYCYTFASPNTFYMTDNVYIRPNFAVQGEVVTESYRQPHGTKYRCIFNITNADDFVPEVPMRDCGWTKYGRTATISFNENKYNIENIIKNEEIYKTLHYNWSVTKDYINNQYKGNTETIKNIVDSFNEIFEDDPENMRYSAYEFNDYDRLISNTYLTNPILPKNVKPFQKIDRSTRPAPSQYQMPAYFMQYIAYCMHGGFPLIIADSSDVSYFFAKFTRKFVNSQDNLINQKDLIQYPHYLESYYLLTKQISSIDFK